MKLNKLIYVIFFTTFLVVANAETINDGTMCQHRNNKDKKINKIYHIKLCVTPEPFAHDRYVLSINNQTVLKETKEKIEMFTTVYNNEKITGKCIPKFEIRNVDPVDRFSPEKPVEVSRTCKIYLHDNLAAKFSFQLA